MGRPVNKKYFGQDANNNIKVTFKTGGTEYNGYIVKQRSTRKFKVTDGSHTTIASLVNKDPGSLSNEEMLIQVILDAGTRRQVTKLYNRVAIVEGTTKLPWNFTPSETDGAAQVIEEAGPTITILTQPVDTLVDLSDSPTDTAVFTIDVTGVAEADVSYQWQVQESGAGAWSNVSRGSGGTTATYTTGTCQVAASPTADSNGDKFKCIVTSSGAANSPLTSAIVTLTVQA